MFPSRSHLREGSCPALHYYSFHSGHCEPMFQGPWIAKQAPDPRVSIPGTVLPGYGVGTRDPRNRPTNYRVTTK